MTREREDRPVAAGGYHGKIRAFVRDIDDPDKCGRVMLFCPAVMGDEDNRDHWVGWAECVEAYATPDVNTDAGSFSPYAVGTPVWIECQDGNPDFPLVTGAVITGEDADHSALPRLAKGQADPSTDGQQRVANGITVPKSAAGTPTYGKWRGIKTQNGFIIEIDESTGNQRMRIRHPSGAFMEYTNPGSLVQQVIADFFLWAGGQIAMTAVGRFVLGAGSQLLLGSASAVKSGVLGEDLLTAISNGIVTPFAAHTHTVTGAATGPPIGVPMVAPTAAVLSGKVKLDP